MFLSSLPAGPAPPSALQEQDLLTRTPLLPCLARAMFPTHLLHITQPMYLLRITLLTCLLHATLLLSLLRAPLLTQLLRATILTCSPHTLAKICCVFNPIIYTKVKTCYHINFFFTNAKKSLFFFSPMRQGGKKSLGSNYLLACSCAHLYYFALSCTHGTVHIAANELPCKHLSTHLPRAFYCCVCHAPPCQCVC